jgi:hypothetical protein
MIGEGLIFEQFPPNHLEEMAPGESLHELMVDGAALQAGALRKALLRSTPLEGLLVATNFFPYFGYP